LIKTHVSKLPFTMAFLTGHLQALWF